MRTPHIAPFSQQAISVLKQIKEISGGYELVFPGDHNPYKPICENTVNKSLHLMGYDTRKDICGHGFRAMAYSALTESGLWSQDAIERQMSHQKRNSVRATYMMQWWSDYLDASREGYVSPYIRSRQNNHQAARTS